MAETFESSVETIIHEFAFALGQVFGTRVELSIQSFTDFDRLVAHVFARDADEVRLTTAVQLAGDALDLWRAVEPLRIVIEQGLYDLALGRRIE